MKVSYEDKVAFYDNAKLQEFNLEVYIQKVLKSKNNKKIESVGTTIDALTEFRSLCNSIFTYFHNKWEKEGLETSTLLRQKNAILGKSVEVNYFKENIEEYLKVNNRLKVWHPKWYSSLIDAIYHECWGLAGIAIWKNSEAYKFSQSAKIIGNKIYFMEDGRMKLQEQTISDDRRKQLIKALLLNENNIYYDGKQAEITMYDGTRITIYGEKLVKDNQEVIILRKYIIPKLSFEEQAKRHTIPKECIHMLRSMVSVGYNVIFTGAVRTGKTTFLETWQMYEDETLEGLMIETGSEIPLHKLQKNAPIIQLIVDDDELEGIVKSIMRSDADYIIAAEARDGRALNIAMRVANKGTRRCKTTYHTTDPFDLCYDIADEIVKYYGGDLYNTIFKVSKSFHYIFHFVQLSDKTQKRLKGIYEIRYIKKEHKITINQICKYHYQSDSWSFKYDIGEDKEEIGYEEDKVAMENFKQELEHLEKMYPMEDYYIFEPKYDLGRGSL